MYTLILLAALILSSVATQSVGASALNFTITQVGSTRRMWGVGESVALQAWFRNDGSSEIAAGKLAARFLIVSVDGCVNEAVFA